MKSPCIDLMRLLELMEGVDSLVSLGIEKRFETIVEFMIKNLISFSKFE